MSRTRFLILAVVLLPGIGVTFGMVGNPFRVTGFRPLVKPFAEFPARLVDGAGTAWTGTDRALPEKAVRIAGMDRYLRRDYRSEDGRNVQLFVSYYGNMRAGIDTIYHNPTICFPSHGWEAAGRAPATAGGAEDGSDPIPVTVFRFAKGRREYVVLNFFVVNGRSLPQSPRDDPLELARQKLSLRSDPGYYVQVQVIADGSAGGREGTETALGFLAAAGPHLFAHF